MDIFLCTDQPECCRECGTRTNIIREFYENEHEDDSVQQIHKCPECGYTYQLDCSFGEFEENEE